MEKFSAKFHEHALEIKQFIDKDLAIIIGKKAVDLFEDNFQKEGFQNGALEKWKEVKRRSDPRIRGARSTRKILTGNTGDLGRSLRYKANGNSVIIYSDIPYAEAHNEGTTTAGRNHSVTIPKRQFIGESKELDELVKAEVDKFFDNLK